MRRPKAIKILNYIYEVQVAEKRYTDVAKCWGWIDSEAEIIHLARGLSPAREREILIHEIMHALIDLLQLHKATEEEICQRLTVGLMTVLKDNRDLAKWLLEN